MPNASATWLPTCRARRRRRCRASSRRGRGSDGRSSRTAPPPATAARHRVAVGQDAAPQREDQREGVLGHGVDGIVADVGDGDPRAAPRHVDHVGAGRGDRDQPQAAWPLRGPPRTGALLVITMSASAIRSATWPAGSVEHHQLMRETQPAQHRLRRQRVPVQEHDPRGRFACIAHDAAILPALLTLAAYHPWPAG